MPVYEYGCDKCQKVLEVQQRMVDAPLSVCPECSGHLRKLISISSFQLKGSGWYADGYSCKPGDCACAPEVKPESASPKPESASPCGGEASCCKQCPAST